MPFYVNAKRLPLKEIHPTIQTYQKFKCNKSLTKLVLHFKKLVNRLARTFSYDPQRHEDIVQVGMIGLIKAINSFDHRLKHNFLSYALPTINGEIKRYLRDCTWNIHIPRSTKELLLRLPHAIDILSIKYSQHPSIKQIADYLNIEEEKINQAMPLLNNNYNNISSNPNLLDNITGNEPGYCKVEQRVLISKLLQELTSREEKVIRLIFFNNMSQRQASKYLNMSQMHVSRTRRVALKKMRVCIKT